MTTIVAQIAPQRSTQYAAVASTLAPHELRLSPLADQIVAVDAVTFSGQPYLKIELSTDLVQVALHELGQLALTSGYFRYYDSLGEQEGPFLRPLDVPFQPPIPADLLATRRYKGKTNEQVTHFLCNIAKFSSAFRTQPWPTLRVLDPLAGGGTTLFVALVLGADALGVEQSARDVSSTASFLQRYLGNEGIACRTQETRLKGLGKRWDFTIGKAGSKASAQRFVFANGDTAQAKALLADIKPPHLIVTDLPYGVQHQGALTGLLSKALPVWSSLLVAGGVVAFAWDATRFPRDEMTALVESASPLRMLNDPPYDALAHRVDRVIKRRDIIVARRG